MVDVPKPFHMQGSEELPPQVTNAAQDERSIDIGSIQTNPSISEYRFSTFSSHVTISSFTDYAEYVQTGKGLFSKARIDPDGRIIISLDLKRQLPDLPPDYAPEVHEFGIDKSKWMEYPSMNIVIMIVGSRGQRFFDKEYLCLEPISQATYNLMWLSASVFFKTDIAFESLPMRHSAPSFTMLALNSSTSAEIHRSS